MASRPSPGGPLSHGTSNCLSIRAKHIEGLERMLNFNNPVDSKTSWQEHWKILIYDNYCRDIISTLFKVADLRKHGVTLHLNINSDRQQVGDVAAIYFVQPTRENIARIGKDCAAGLYDSMHLNFSSTIASDQLHSLATDVAEAEGGQQRIAKVFDQHMHFLSLDHRLFSLMMENSYVRLNDPDISDASMEDAITEIVNGLFSVLVTLGVVPVIRCPTGDAAGMVGERLNKKLRDHFLSTNNLFKGQAFSSSYFARPLLIIADRSQDLSVNLQHSWTYEAMLHDVLGMKLNKVTVNEEGEAAKSRAPKVYDLGSSDAFWVDNCGKPFPSVTDEIEERLNAWKAEYAAIGAQGQADYAADAAGGGGIDALTRAAQLVPELTERKRLLDQHTGICTALLDQIKSRELDNFFSLESAIVSGSVYNAKSALLQVFSDGALGTAEDKMRLFVIYYLCNPQISDSDAAEYTAALEALGADLKLMNYLNYLRKMHSLSSRAAAMGQQAKAGGKGGMSLTEIMTGIQAGTKSATSVLKSVSASLGAKRELPVTRLVDALMDNKPHAEADNFRYFDPNLHDDSGNRPKEQRKAFKEAIVFVVGSGGYVEYQDLVDYSKKSPTPRNIIYGSTELVTASDFLRQLTELGGKRFMSI